ncbi:MAG: glycoside hydrolase family 43 protein, partial [Flavobacterium sp.]|nr:glycoside hydrolase family 43 protein [Flavobacterium sp.]
IPLEPKLKMPQGATENKTGKEGFFPNGNFTFNDNFTSSKLDYRWIGLRGPREKFITTSKKGLTITPFETNIKEMKPTSTLFYRQQHNSFSLTTTIDYKPKSDKDLAGVVALQNEGSNYVFGITMKDKDYYVVLQKNQKVRRDPVTSTIVASAKIDIKKPVQLQMKANGDEYVFSYSTNGTDFVPVGGTVSGDILSTDVAGGFTGCLLGLYATSSNDARP